MKETNKEMTIRSLKKEEKKNKLKKKAKKKIN